MCLLENVLNNGLDMKYIGSLVGDNSEREDTRRPGNDRGKGKNQENLGDFRSHRGGRGDGRVIDEGNVNSGVNGNDTGVGGKNGNKGGSKGGNKGGGKGKGGHRHNNGGKGHHHRVKG